MCYFLLQMIFPCLETVAGSVEQGGDLSVPDFGRKHEEHQAVAVVEIIGGGVKVQELLQFLRREQLGSQPADLLLVLVQLFVQIVCDFRIRTSQSGGQLDDGEFLVGVEPDKGGMDGEQLLHGFFLLLRRLSRRLVLHLYLVNLHPVLLIFHKDDRARSCCLCLFPLP